MTPGPGFYDPSIGESLRKLRESFMKPHKMPQGRYRLEKIDVILLILGHSWPWKLCRVN